MNKKIFVRNFPFASTKQDLEALFESSGKIIDIYIPFCKETGSNRGFAFIEFSTHEEMENALLMNGKNFNGRIIQVNIAKNDKTKKTPFNYK